MKSDIKLQHDVMQELEWEPSVDAAPSASPPKRA